MTEPSQSQRFYALDSVRALAMLLGVYYHALVFGGMIAGGRPPIPTGSGISPTQVGDFLHSFRMPLFFLIAGFFSSLMLTKHGTLHYLFRRWIRIGLPLFLGIFTIVPLYHLAFSGGMPGPGGGGRGQPRVPPNINPSPPIAPGIPAEKGKSNDGDGQDASKRLAGANNPGIGPGARPPSGRPAGGPPPGPSWTPPVSLGSRIFGSWARYFTLAHLWFLWYLLLFATVTPLVATVFGWLFLLPGSGVILKVSRWSIRFCLAPLVLGLASTPALLLALGGFGGWTLQIASGFWLGFPDFLFRLEWDLPIYLIYFLAGWWLHRERDRLPDVARVWLPALVVGIAAHVAAANLSATYFRQIRLPHYGLIRLGTCSLYAVGSAYTAFGFLGLFQRYVNRPSVLGRYLADTAFWVYMIHLPLVIVMIRWLGPLGLPWWLQSLLATILSMGAALLSYEAIIRPTPLMRLFGPASLARPSADTLTSANGNAVSIVGALADYTAPVRFFGPNPALRNGADSGIMHPSEIEENHHVGTDPGKPGPPP